MESGLDEIAVGEEDGEDGLFLIDTAFENSLCVAESWKHNKGLEGLLKRDDYISVRATALTNVVDREELHHSSDIDGLTIEWLNIATGLKSNYRHLEIMPLGVRSVRRFFPVIKKHLNLCCFNENSFRVLKDTVGSQIIYDGLFETWLGFIPDVNEWRTIYDFSTQSRHAYQYFERLRTRFQECLKELFERGIAVDTLAKNNLNDARRIFVLPGDHCHILECFQRALDETALSELPGFKKVLLTFRFGDKCQTSVELPVRDENAVKDICVHAGHRISSDFIDVFWSREGVRQVTGSKCIISSAFSFIECCNLQSPLTTSRLEISAGLRSVCTFPQNIRFVQMYNDLPHRYPKARVHPVSASVIMLEGLLTDVAQRNLYRDASAYLSEVHNNFFQINRGVCRLEFVLNIGKRAGAVTGAEFINVNRLEELLEKHAMIVPFLRNAGTFKMLRAIGLYLHARLQRAFTTARGTSNTRLVWDVYQTELAVEKLLWGRPLCTLSNQHSKNLGPGLQYPSRSLTDQKGFLCLENSGSCCVDDRTLPPLSLYTKNDTMQRKIVSISGFYNLIGGSQLVLGRRVLEIFLRDCHASGKVFYSFEHFVLQLKVQTGNVNKKIVGGVSVAHLVKLLSTSKKCKWTFVFSALKQLMLKMNVNVDEVIHRGITALNLGYFPAVRSYDENRSVGLNWQFNYGFWVLTDIPDSDRQSEREAALVQNLVLTELEKRKLCHSSKYIGSIFPWITNVLEKIREKKLPTEGKVLVSTFISCVAFLQEGRYVDFYALNKLERDLPLKQSDLRTLEIQSSFLLPSVNNVKIYRLHSSIPTKVAMKKNKEDDTDGKTKESENVPVPDVEEDRVDQIEPEDNQAVAEEHIDTHHLHVPPVPSHKCNSRWSPAEVAILVSVKDKKELTLPQKFREYQQACRSINLADRSFNSFRRKVQRLKTL